MLRFIIAVTSVALAGAAYAQAQPIPRAQFIADMDSQFRKMDADKNGQLTRTEIEQFQKLTAIAEAQARNRALFAQLDADKNGQLSQAEFGRVNAPVPTANAQPMIARMDGNRDSQINLIEHRTATLVNFDRLDVDKDGIVTPTEMKAGGIIK
jgi:Ca2+-binding EF-hand superfamily protein